MTRDEVYSWWTPEQLMYGCERLVADLHSYGSEPIFLVKLLLISLLLFVTKAVLIQNIRTTMILQTHVRKCVMNTFKSVAIILTLVARN